MSPFQSIRLRLPLLIAALLVAVVTAFVWAAYREVESTLVRAGGDRARGAAEQVANLLAGSSQTGMGSLIAIAADERVRRYLQNPTNDSGNAARAAVAPIIAAGALRVELWNAVGSRLLSVSAPPKPASGPAPAALPESKHPTAAGLGALQSAGNVVYTDSVAAILGGRTAPGRTSTRPVIGYLDARTTLSVNPPGILNRLVGSDAVIEIGNKAGGTWTDLTRVVKPPPVAISSNGVAEYRGPNGDWRLGALSTIPNTPWAVWVEFPLSTIMAPAQAFLERMIGLALIVVLIGAAIAEAFSVRITRPLQELANAADGIAAGDYSRRVSAARADEIGRLGCAFNAMVEKVKETQQQLEERVIERGQALDALRASEAHYRSIVEVALDCIITIDAAGRVIEFNPAAEKTFGYKKSDAVGRELAELIVPLASRVAHRKGLSRFFATGQSVLIGQRVELTAMRSDGTEFPVELALSAVRVGGSPGVTGVARDISERKRMEEIRLKIQSMEERNQRTMEANRLKSEFVANMSHELRTPLNAIIGFTYLMHKGMVGSVSAEQEEYLGDILTSSQHLLQLINDVLDLAKVESGKMEFRPEQVDLTKLVDEVRDTLRVLAANRNLQIETEVDPKVSAAVIDPARLKQILFNYMSNAIKFTPAGGRVRVAIAPEGPDMFRIDVHDTGMGIAAADLAKLFVEFQQLDAGTSKEHQGTGLGLALVKHIAEAQGGWVAVTSVVGKGSTFSAILPCKMKMAPVDNVNPDGVSPMRASSGNRTILVIDDDPATLKLAEVALRDLGCRPVCKDNAADALQAVQTEVPAVVIVDLVMPQVDGFDFISQMRAAPGGRDIPVIVWTVKDLNADERSRLGGPVAAIVSKSTGGSQALVQALRRLLPLESSPVESPW